MSYLRGQYYTYSDGANIHLPLSMPMEIFNALVMMQYYHMTKKERAKAEKLAYKISGGNFGCDKLSKKLGKPTSTEILKAIIKVTSKKEIQKRHNAK